MRLTMSNKNTPKPETTSAYLSLEKGRATLHHYLETREVEVDGQAWEFIFKCVETGTERRWGLIERLTFAEEGN
jgi:hypothetical protein